MIAKTTKLTKQAPPNQFFAGIVSFGPFVKGSQGDVQWLLKVLR